MEHGVTRAFAEKFAALLGEVPHKLATLHERASDPHRDGFSPCVSGASRQLSVGLENQPEGLPEIAPGFGQSPPLRVGARNFLYIGHIPSPALLNDRREFSLHVIPSSPF
jgi:hypothetical protein